VRAAGAAGVGAVRQGLQSFPFQLNFSSSVHRIPSFNHECVLELLKLSSNVNKCEPLLCGGFLLNKQEPGGGALHSSTFRLNLSRV